MAFQDVYPEGHQGGVGIIQNGVRVATNGDLRLEPAPGQWAPVPVQKDRAVDRAAGEIVTTLAYPDPDKDRKGFNPIDYPDLRSATRYACAPRAPACASPSISPSRCRRPGSAKSASTWSCTRRRCSVARSTWGTPATTRAAGLVPAPAQRPGARRRRARGAARAARHRSPPGRGARGARAAAGDRERARAARAARRAHQSPQRLVRGARADPGGRDRARDRLADHAARAAGLALAAGRARVAGRLPPGAAQGRGDRDRSRRHRRAARDAGAHRRGRPARDRAGSGAPRLGPLPALSLSTVRLLQRAPGGHLPGRIRDGAHRAISHRAATSTSATSGSRRWERSCRCRCATCAWSRSTASGTACVTWTTR